MKRTHMATLVWVAVVVLLVAGPALGTSVTPTSVSTPVNVTHDKFADNEESQGMSPDGQLLAGAWNDWDYNDGCGFSYSTNGGDSWARHTFVPGLTAFTNDPNVPGTGTFAVAGDPAVVYNPASGHFDVICQAFGSATGNQIQLLSTTFDAAKADPNADENYSYGTAVGGAPAWTTPVAVTTGTSNGSQKGSNGQFPDHETATVDTGNGGHHHYGRLYVTWAEFNGSGRSPIDIAYSDNDGHTWTGPIRVSDNNDQFNQDARPIVAPNGTLYVTWTNGPNESSLKNNQVEIAKSTDGGNTWSGTYVVAPIVAPVPGQLPNSRYRVFSNAWSAVDQQSGRVVIVYNDEKTGASNVYAVHNLTAGDLSTWSKPLRIKPSKKEQFFAWVSAAPNGRVDTAYYDRSCDPKDTKNCVTLSSTVDSGASWSNTALTTQGFDGDKYQACLAFVQQPDCGTFFLGDYIAVSSNNSKAQVLYTGNGPKAMDVFSQRATF